MASTGAIRVSGGMIDDQMLSGDIRYFRITSADFSGTISDGTVKIAYGHGTGSKTFAEGEPVPNSAADQIATVICRKATIVQCDEEDDALIFVLENKTMAWAKYDMSGVITSPASQEIQSAIRALGTVTTPTGDVSLSSAVVKEKYLRDLGVGASNVSAVDSVFGRDGDVVAQQPDYSAYYADINHSHADTVKSIYGRSGDVEAQSGDYLYGDVGSEPIATGLISGGEITISATPSTATIAGGEGIVVDTTGGFYNPIFNKVQWGDTSVSFDPTVNVTTWIYVDVNGIFDSTPNRPTRRDYVTHIVLGKLIPQNTGEVLVVDQFNAVGSTSQNLTELMVANIGVISGGGLRIRDSLDFGIAESTYYSPNVNYRNDQFNPNVVTIPEQDPVTFEYITQLGTIIDGNASAVDPRTWNDSGDTLTQNNSSNSATIQYLYVDAVGTYRMLYGQELYSDSEIARTKLSEDFDKLVVPDALSGSSVVYAFIMEGDTTELSDNGDAIIVNRDRFGTVVEYLNDLHDVSSVDASENDILLFKSGIWNNRTNREEYIADLNRTRWMGEWTTPDTAYKKNDIVRDGDWLMVANTDTTTRPEPVDPSNPFEPSDWDVMARTRFDVVDEVVNEVTAFVQGEWSTQSLSNSYDGVVRCRGELGDDVIRIEGQLAEVIDKKYTVAVLDEGYRPPFLVPITVLDEDGNVTHGRITSDGELILSSSVKKGKSLTFTAAYSK